MFCSRFYVLSNEGGMASHTPWENIVAMIESARGSIDRELDSWFAVLAGDKDLYTFARDFLKGEENDKIQEASMWKSRREFLESTHSRIMASSES